ncbi:MAG: hypothetical protein NTW16_02715, partial [Bacteroidetes bacterium]|nr:hypothetical protein [Bacteroidota bacterium]
DAVAYEVKDGPYSPANDKNFAPWAPKEGDAGTTDYLTSLVKLVKNFSIFAQTDASGCAKTNHPERNP